MADQYQRTSAQAEKRQEDIAIWSAVRYLDSPTDYRECLPTPRRPACFPKTEFVTLDDGQFPWAKLCATAVMAILLCVSLLVWLRN